jgi:hypothetical protein
MATAPVLPAIVLERLEDIADASLRGISYPKLALGDSVHDYWQERKTVAKDEDEEDEEAYDENKMVSVRGSITGLNTNVLRGVGFGGAIDDMNSIMRVLTEGRVTSTTANFERRLEAYFEEKYSPELYSNLTESITYDDILDDSRRAALLARYTASPRKVFILEISRASGAPRVKAYSPEQRQQIADFITTFMFGDALMPPKLTFDGKSGVVGHAYKPVSDVMCVMTPQYVGDSAPTSFNNLSGRNEFIFPGQTEMPIRSNYYTRGRYTMSYVNRGFSAQNLSGFSLRVNDFEMPFSTQTAQYTEGPSVNYLGDMIQEARAGRPISGVDPNKRGMFPIGKLLPPALARGIEEGIRGDTEGILYDLKRSGDHEQVLATIEVGRTYPRMIGVTGDILAALFYRLMKQSCILHVADKMYLYAFPRGGVAADPVEMARIRAERVQRLSSELEQLVVAGVNPTRTGIQLVIRPELRAALEAERANIVAALNGSYRPPKMRPADATNPVKSQIRNIVTGLIRIRLLNMIQQIDAIMATLTPVEVLLEGVEAAAVAGIPDIASEVINSRRVVATEALSADVVNQVYSPIIKAYGELEEQLGALNLKKAQRRVVSRAPTGEILNSPLVIDTGTVSYITADGVFAPIKSEIMNYDLSIYTDLYEKLLAVNGTILGRYRTGRGRGTIMNDFAKIELLRTIQDIQDSFFDTHGLTPSQSEIISRIINPNSIVIPAENVANIAFTNARYVEFFELAGMMGRINVILPEANRVGVVGAVGTVVVGGAIEDDISGGDSGSVMVGGAGDPQQYRDVSDLFRNVCFTSARFVESIYSNKYPELLFIACVNNAVGIMNKYSNERRHRLAKRFKPDARAAINSYLLNAVNVLDQLVPATNVELKGRIVALRDEISTMGETAEVEDAGMVGGVGEITRPNRTDVKGTSLGKKTPAQRRQEALDVAQRVRLEKMRETPYMDKLIEMERIFKIHSGIPETSTLQDIKVGIITRNPNVLFDVINEIISKPELGYQAIQLYEDVQTQWELGLSEIQNTTDYEYEAGITDAILSFLFNPVSTEGDPLAIRKNDIRGLYLTTTIGTTGAADTRLITLLLLAVLDSTFTSSDTGYLDDYIIDANTYYNFDNASEWNGRLSEFIYPYLFNIRVKLSDPGNRTRFSRGVTAVLAGGKIQHTRRNRKDGRRRSERNRRMKTARKRGAVNNRSLTARRQKTLRRQKVR